MDESTSELTPRDYQLLLMINEGSSVAEAAEAVGWELEQAGRRLQALRQQLGVQ